MSAQNATDPLDWKASVIAAAQKHSEEMANDEAERKREKEVEDGKRLKAKLDRLGVPTPVEIVGREVVIDGVTFRLGYYDYRYSLYMVGTCPNCGEQRSSHDIYSTESLGYLLQNFEPQYHECSRMQTQRADLLTPGELSQPAAPSLPTCTAAERALLDALSGLISDWGVHHQ